MQPVAFRPDAIPGVLGIGRTKVFELIRTGQLRSIKVGRARLVPATAIAEFLRGSAAAEGPRPAA